MPIPSRLEVSFGQYAKSLLDEALAKLPSQFLTSCMLRQLVAVFVGEVQELYAAVLDMHTIKPLDREAVIKAAEKTGCIVTAEEANILGGLGGAVAEVVTETCPVPVLRVGVKDIFGRSGDPYALLERYELTAKDVAAAARRAVAMKK